MAQSACAKATFFMLLCFWVLPQFAADNPPAIFVFGDSLLDAGNNNYLMFTLAKADRPYHGIDFPMGATGRFCNGRTVADIVSEMVGLPYPKPFMSPESAGSNMKTGLNFASAAAGILKATGMNYGERIPMQDQVTAFAVKRAELKILLSPSNVSALISESLFLITIGSNDYLNNYLVEGSPTPDLFSADEYQRILISTLSTELTLLHVMGARKFLLLNVGPMGCIPHFLAQTRWDSRGKCIPEIDNLIVNFNDALKVMVSVLNQNLEDSMLILGSMYDVGMDYIDSAIETGMNVQDACCGSGAYNGGGACFPDSNLCSNRTSYFFWDPFHPTEIMNERLASEVFYGDEPYVWPMNVSQLLNYNTSRSNPSEGETSPPLSSPSSTPAPSYAPHNPPSFLAPYSSRDPSDY